MKRIRIAFFCLLLVIFNSCDRIRGELVQQQADSANGFNFPYFLFIPEKMSKDEKVFLIIEPNNTGHTSDDFEDHLRGAKQMITNDGYLGKYLSDSLNFPLLIPVFPRSDKDWKTYTHALDRDAIRTKESSIERIDVQLLAMVEDAKSTLSKMGYTIHDKSIMTGFSASATFANRFVSIHPDKIQVCAAGGLNGMLMLPVRQINGKSLNYPIGCNDFEQIFGDSLDLPSLKEVPQFFFMGDSDDNDAVAYDDAYDSDERELVYKILGKEMMPARWEYCSNVYKTTLQTTKLKTYKEIGHDLNDAIRNDVLRFVKAALN